MRGHPALDWSPIVANLSTDDLANLFWPTERAERELLPLMLFRRPGTLGRVQSLWNLTQALRASEVDSFRDTGRFLRGNPDVVHATGYHATATDLAPGSSAIGETLWRFTNRIHSSPSVQAADRETYEYLRHMVAVSRRPLLTLAQISRHDSRSKLAWRYTPPGVDKACQDCGVMMTRVRGNRLYCPPCGRKRKLLNPSRVVGADRELNPVWPFIPEAAPVERIQGADLLVRIDQIVPHGLPKQIRDDVCQDLVLAVLEGEVGAADIEDHHSEYVRAMFKRFPIKYGHISLDAPPPWDKNGRTLAETLAG